MSRPRRLLCETLEDRRLLSITPYPVPLEPQDPLGSLVYGAPASGSISALDDTDDFTIDLDDGQTVTVVVDPNAALRPTIELLDPDDNSIGSATAGAAGEDAVLQTVATTGAGTYTISVGGASTTTGAYTVQLTLNAAVEDESHDGPADDDLASAQNLDAGFVALSDGPAQRNAVLGSFQSEALTARPFPSHRDVGNPNMAGSYSYNAASDVHSVTGGGRDIFAESDQFHYAYQPLSGDVEITARVLSFADPNGIHGWAKAGLMIRETLDDGSKHALMAMSYSTGGAAFQYRSETGGGSQSVHPTPNESVPYWVKLVRRGDEFKGYQSADGSAGSWTMTGSITIPMAAEVHLGLAVSAHYTSGHLCTAQFDNLYIHTGFETMPEDWYEFTLDTGESATLALQPQTSGDVRLQLYDADSNLLAGGVSAANVSQVIHNFVAPSAGTYFARVRGLDVDYNLVVTRNADFDTEINDDPDSAQPLAATGSALGYLAGMAPGTPVGKDAPLGKGPSGNAAGADGDQGNLGAGTAGPQAKYAPNRLIVRFVDSVSKAKRAEVLATHPGKVVRELPLIDAVVVELSEAERDVMKAAAAWSADRCVLYAEPDYQVQAVETIPNDPLFSQLWGMHNEGQTGGTADADIDAPEAWDVFTGSSDVVIAGIDTGIDYNHEDLVENMWVNPGEIPGDDIDNDGNGYVDDVYGIDAANGDSDPWDDAGHGTHTAGTFGGVGDNGIGVAGVNWDVEIMALKFLDAGGSGWDSDAIICLDYLTMMKTAYGVNVVASNNSWGGGGFSQALKDAIEVSNNAGVMFVAAAGNYGQDNDVNPFYPATYDLDGIISVAATDHNDNKAGFSHYGATTVDLGAPGVSILSSIPGNQYMLGDGTSMASPHVAGAVGMLMAYSPQATLAEVKAALLDSVDVVPGLDGITVSGGRMNLSNSLALMGDPGDYYSIEVLAGDALLIGTSTPAGGPGEFENLLDPAVELYDPAGSLVAANDNSAPDGRNARLTYTALAGGTYTVRVLSAAEKGEYVLDVRGNTGGLPKFMVSGTDPADGQPVAASPETFTVDFNDAVSAGSLHSSDLTVDGVSATGILDVPDGDTVVFELPPFGEGEHHVVIAAGAIRDVQGTAIEAFAGRFSIDLTGPRVIASSVEEGELVPAGHLVYTAYFDEELNGEGLDAADVSLVGLSGIAPVPDVFSYDPAGSALTLEFAELPEDEYTLTLQSGDGQFEDLVGNDLDGRPSFPLPSGDGTPGGDFVLHFGLDVVRTGASPFVRLEPLGGLMSRSGENLGLINYDGDPDEYTLFAEAGQTISAVVSPDDPAATLSVELVGLAGPILAAGPGMPASLPPVPLAADGTYTIRVSGDTVGTFALQIGKNLAAEAVDTADGSGLAIDDSYLSLGSGRFAVLGNSQPWQLDVDALVWGVQPATGEILMIDPATGDVFYRFQTPDALSATDTRIGLSIAEDGESLLYVNSDVDPDTLYRLNPSTGAVLSVETTDGLTYDGLGFDWVAPAEKQDTIYSANMDADPGWTLEGEWAFGQPTGGGDWMYDPTSGYTGSNVIGYNLNGDYTDNMPVYYATTPAINASRYEDVTLSFYRWLCVEGYFDDATIQVSNNGTDWTTVWESGDNGAYDSSWVYQEFDISAVADGQPTVYLRWGMGPTDGSVTYPGWNLDDVMLTGTLTVEPKIFLGREDVEVRRQDGFSGTESSHLTLFEPSGALGGDGAGRQFAYVPGTGIVEFEPDAAETVVKTLPAPATDLEGLAFEGIHLYASTATGDLYTLDPDTGDVLNVVSVPGGGLFGLGALFGSGELIVNGGFETGDFTGWTALSNGLGELTPWTVGPPSDTPQLPVLITEAGTADPDFVEIQNVSNDVVDTSGWLVVVNNAYDIGHPPDINAWHTAMWDLPDSIDPNEVLYRQDLPGEGSYWGENIFWRTSGPGWAMILDDQGEVVDFVVWKYTPAEIASFDVTINGRRVTSEGIWRGEAVGQNDAGSSLQRIGNADHDDNTDWLTVAPLSMGGQNEGFGTPFFNPSPLSGDYSAYNGFEGEAGLQYELYQDVMIPAAGSVKLTTNHRIEYAGGGTGVEDRVLEISIRDTDNHVIQTLYTENVTISGPPTDLGWNTQVFDVSAYAGQTVRIHFSELIPETYTCASIIELDDLSLAVGEGNEFWVPEVDVYALDLTGKAGQRIDVVLAAQHPQDYDFSSSRLDLLGVDGATVLATAVPDPLDAAAESYDLGILDFVVPADGVYTLRLTSTVDDEYAIVVTDSLVFDSEPDNDLEDPLQPRRTLDEVNAALGYLSTGGSSSGAASVSIPASDGNFPRGTAKPSLELAPAGMSAGGNFSGGSLSGLGTKEASSAYGWEAFNSMLAQCALDAPEVLTNQGTQTAYMFAGDFDASGDFSTAYAIDNNTNTLVSMDTATGATTPIGPITPYSGENWTGMAADPTSGIMYASSTSVSASSLYTVDLTTGAATRIGPITNSPGIIALGVDDRGVIYGHDIVNDSLIRIDKQTAEGTIVGSLGFDANYAQGMDFDHASGQLYLAAYNNSNSRGELRIADRETGATVLVGVLGETSHGGMTEVCWLGVAAGGGAAIDYNDLYDVTLEAGETVVIHTQTPWDDPDNGPRNDLDSALSLLDASGMLVASDTDSEDGRNGRLVFTATSAGTYTIEVQAEDGTGEYLLKTEFFPEPQPLISINDVEVVEGDSGTIQAVFTISLSEDPAGPVTVQLDTLDGTATVADGDYWPISGLVLAFDPGGGLTRQVAVDVHGDTDIEAREHFSVRLGNATGAILADRHGEGTILNDDTRISIPEELPLLEGDRGTTPFTLTISLVAPADVPVSVDYATGDGTATLADLDYVPINGTVKFDPNEVEMTITIDVLADTQIETHETFFLNFSHPSQPVDNLQTVATIQNEDTEVSIDDVSLPEGDVGSTEFVFTISLAAPSAVPVRVGVNTADGTATVKDDDYTAIRDKLLTFEPGETAKTLTVAVRGDAKPEGDETFRVNLTAEQPVARSQGLGTILNDDVPAAVTGRYVFYNNSIFDDNDPQPNANDDHAIAVDKQALMPGQRATFANYTSYSRGINGVMIDVGGLPAGVRPGIEDFQFRVGNNDDPSTWAAPAAVQSITVRPGEGASGADRVTILWPDSTIQKQWLQVTMLATANTRLPEPDVFYFGNAVGESGGSTTDAKVNAYDMLGARDNSRTFINPATIDFDYDYNRDARVNGYDMLIARDNQTNFLNALKLITVPGEDAATMAIRPADAVFRQAAGRASGPQETATAKLDWLLEFEQLDVQKLPARKSDPAAALVDELLATQRL